MIPLKVSEIAKAVGGTLLCGNPDIEITSVACDSREVKDGTLLCRFVARRSMHISL